ncbi:class II aldolase/adducin family protein, partial [Puniceibacterium confluentis]|uniref:class II aldolase/adducin family protein n=1 Tax=Puniceibacterium confluentis TaxID=1958944 RepID=UPI00356A1275
RDRIVDDLGRKYVMFLRNHGVLVLGRSVGEAVTYAMNLERSCQAQIAALGMGLTPVVLSEDIAEHTARQYEKAYDSAHAKGSDPEWAAMLRRLDRAAPDYSD